MVAMRQHLMRTFLTVEQDLVMDIGRIIKCPDFTQFTAMIGLLFEAVVGC
jgi:hypothetical protein